MKKIMLCCNAGMSTSLLVQKMQSEVESRGLDIEVEARPMNEAHDHLDECDILLLGPQIGYTKGDFEKEAAGRFPVEVINMVDYGRMNAAGIIGLALGDLDKVQRMEDKNGMQMTCFEIISYVGTGKKK